MVGICSPKQSASILLWLSLLFLLTATKFHRPSWKILNSDIQFPKHLTKGVPLSEKKRWKFSSSQPWESFSCSARRKAKCRAPASPPCQPWHTQPHHLPLVSIGFHSQGNAWELGGSFFCFPAFSITPKSCMQRIRLFAYANDSAQNIPSCVSSLQTAACTQHRTVYSQFIP